MLNQFINFIYLNCWHIPVADNLKEILEDFDTRFCFLAENTTARFAVVQSRMHGTTTFFSAASWAQAYNFWLYARHTVWP
jgi:hypothetical protein